MLGPLNPIHVAAAAFCLSAFSGLAALLRSGQKVNWVAVVSAMLNSGLFGLAIAWLWYIKFQDNVYFLLGMCILMGLGGAASLDFAVQAVKKGGLSIGGITVKVGDDQEMKGDDHETKG